MYSLDHKKIRHLRRENGMSQSAVANALGLSRPSYALIETGDKIPTVAQFYQLVDMLKAPPEELMLGAQSLNNHKLDPLKFRQVITACIAYGADSDGKITKTKLAKLIYLVDFAWFYHHKKPMTGALYRAIQRGPVADEYFRVIDQLFENQVITIEPKGAALMISAIDEQKEFDQLNRLELGMVKKVCDKWRGRTTQDIVDFTHNQAPYKNTSPGGFVAYKYILLEDPGAVY